MSRRSITTALATVALAFGAAACGDRENVEQSNDGQQDPAGGQATQQEPASGITPTGEEQPSVTQPEGG